MAQVISRGYYANAALAAPADLIAAPGAGKRIVVETVFITGIAAFDAVFTDNATACIPVHATAAGVLPAIVFPAGLYLTANQKFRADVLTAAITIVIAYRIETVDP